MKIYYLEGNIGAGKSTTLAELAKSPKIDIVEEPLAVWQGAFGENLLQLFYDDPTRWAFTFQIAAFVTRAKAAWEIMSNLDIVILERSIYSDRHVFARAARANGNMAEVEWQLYKRMWSWQVANFCMRPDKILYLRTPAEECLRRLQERDRTEEVGVTLEYLLQLERYHDDWLLGKPSVIVLNGMEYWDADRVLAILEAA